MGKGAKTVYVFLFCMGIFLMLNGAAINSGAGPIIHITEAGSGGIFTAPSQDVDGAGNPYMEAGALLVFVAIGASLFRGGRPKHR
jgi:hypothetical protein